MGDSTPICRCRVLYLGSAVPRQSKDGLQGIQEPLRSLYPSEGAVGAKGIDSWLSVWSNGILLENVDENLKQITRFFPIESLHYCAAVRQVLIPERGNTHPEPKFLPLDSPFARMPRAQHPPIFAAILRRTTGIKVLECHVFICKREAAANALVRCCFHAYADNSYARQLETGGGSSVYGTLKSGAISKSSSDLTGVGLANGVGNGSGGGNHHLSLSAQGGWRSRTGSTTTLNSLGRASNGHANGSAIGMNGSSAVSAAEGYTSVKNFYGSSADLNVAVDDGDASFNGDENHKVWNGSQDQLDSIGPLESPYELFAGNTSTLGRPLRARQISTPIDVPPPPVKDERKTKRDKKLTKSSGSQSLSGTLIRPKPVHPAPQHRSGFQGPSGPGSVTYGHVSGHGLHAARYHTISHRGIPPGSHSHLTHHPPPHPSQNQVHMMHHPHIGGLPPMQIPVMMPQQYATLQPSRSTGKKKKKDKKSGAGGGVPVGMPIVPPIYAFQQQVVGVPAPQLAQSLIGETRPLGHSSRKLAASMGNGLDDSGNSGAESPSPGGTGIYKRKGHLNERAFSYSIRQEHRSRSHGSLASLQFNPADIKKEREIAQMVAGLDLNEGERPMGPNTLQRKHAMTMSNGGLHGPGPSQHPHAHPPHPHAIYGPLGPASSFGMPRR
uniref:GM02933p n=1 Tax=Drosophila melanogaster TaxID=7227 RepID=Q8T953_DROME|nr:GM02933p [Drosophila melanogaster]